MLYVPRTRADFYGRQSFKLLMRRLADKSIRYVVVGGGDIDAPAGISVENLGWRDNLHSVYENATVLIRNTPRDGLSLMVLEALSYGRYVLWTQDFPHTREIHSYSDMEREIRALYAEHERGILQPQAAAAEMIAARYGARALHQIDRAGVDGRDCSRSQDKPGDGNPMIERITLEEWLAFDAAHPAPTFFARPAWARALAKSYGNMAPAPLRVRVGEKSFILPLVQLHGGRLRWRDFCGFPLGGYTCCTRDDGAPATTDEWDSVLQQLARFCDTSSFIPWPLAAGPRAGIGTPHETGVVDLSQGIDAALSGVEGIFRRMAGQAQRRGVICAPSRSPDAADVYYGLLEASAKRWGLDRPTVPKTLIEAIVEYGGNDVEIWFARADEREIAGGVVFYGGKEFFFWSAAMLAEFGRLRPSNALNFALMRAAADRGMLWYNLGSSEGLPGVARFKQEMGAQTVAYREVRLTGVRFNLYTQRPANAPGSGQRLDTGRLSK